MEEALRALQRGRVAPVTTTDDRVPLHPYYSQAQPDRRDQYRMEPLLFAPRYVRTRNMGRWHRPRYGFRHRDGRESVTMWCGQTVTRLSAALGRGDVPSTDEACGTCEGRALGAGIDPTPDGLPRLVFTGRYGQPPKKCPGSRSERLAVEDPDNWRRATCRVCHEYVKMRAGGSVYNSSWGMALHAPGPALVDPCPEHGWYHLRPAGEMGVTCACMIPGESF